MNYGQHLSVLEDFNRLACLLDLFEQTVATGFEVGKVELFHPGDVCLAQDCTGEGHIDRVHGFVQVAVLIVDDADLWPLTD